MSGLYKIILLNFSILSFVLSGCEMTKEVTIGGSNHSAQTNPLPISPVPTEIDLDPPNNLTGVATSSNQINLNWVDNSIDEVGFRVDYSTASTFSNKSMISVSKNVQSASLVGLNPNTNYYIRIIAIGTAAESIASNTIVIKTLEMPVTIPAAPSSLTANSISSAQINLAWNDIANNETGFEIDKALNSNFSSGLTTITLNSANTTSYTFTGLSASTLYYFRVRTKNSAGLSSNSPVASATTQAPPATAPVAPTNLAATAISHNQVNLTWVDNSSNETGFTVQYSTSNTFNSGVTTTLPVTAQNITTLSVTGLSSATTYYFRVSSVNNAGASNYTSYVTATTLQAPLPPNAPSNLAGTATSVSSVNLTWVDNSSNESGFIIERSLSNSFTNPTTTNVAANQTSSSISGLSAATVYYFRIKSTNSVGSSSYSNSVSITTQNNAPTIPASPSNLIAAASSPTQVNLNWTDNSNNETGFIVQYSTSSTFPSSSTTTMPATSQNSTSASVTGLSSATTYYFKVAATNAAGTSAYSTTATVTTNAGGSVFDPLDFAPGTQFFSYAPNSIPYTNREGKCSNTATCTNYPTVPTAGVTVSTKNQMLSYPNPRYKIGNTLPKNFNGMDNQYLAGRMVYSDAEAQADTPGIVDEMARNFNYGIALNIAGGYNPNSTGGPDRISQLAIQVANANPQFSVDMFTLWNSASWNISNQNLATDCYLKKADGSTFMTPYNAKQLRPTFSNYSPCPDSLWQYDGDAMKAFINSYNMPAAQKGLSSRPIPVNRVFENGEMFYPIGQWGSFSDYEADSVAVSEYNRSGIPVLSNGQRNWQKFQSQWATRVHTAYRDRLLSSPLTTNAQYMIYQNSGNSNYYFSWEHMRNLHYNFRNGARLSTLDYYPETQKFWTVSGGPWHGIGFFYDYRYYEKQFGDHWIAPYTTAGWYFREEKNIRPGAYLGQLKLLLGLGSVMFHQEFFSLYAPFPNSRNWNWQMASASYAQGLLSHVEDFIYNSTTLDGDKTLNGHPAMNFNTNDSSKHVVVRKHNTQNKYMIAGTIQPIDNSAGTTVDSTATITLDGQSITFPIRKQGSVYIYDKTNASAPLFYQLDGWHESTHPAYWSRDFKLEAELFDNASISGFGIKSEGISGNNFNNVNSYLSFSNTSAQPLYKFQPRQNSFGTGSDNSYYVWVKARNKGTTATTIGVKLQKNGTMITNQTISNISGNTWKYYRVEATGQPASFSNLTVGETHDVILSPGSTDIEIDSIYLTPKANLILTP